MAPLGRQGRQHVQQAPVRAQLVHCVRPPAGLAHHRPLPAPGTAKVTPAPRRRSRAPDWNGCSPTTGTRCANGCCGGCSTKPAPGRRRSSAWTSPTSTWSSAAPWSSRRAATACLETGKRTRSTLDFPNQAADHIVNGCAGPTRPRGGSPSPRRVRPLRGCAAGGPRPTPGRFPRRAARWCRRG
jgi:hypothetical protein